MSEPSPVTAVHSRVTFGTAIRLAFQKYAEFEGRATRPEYWWFILFVVLMSAALGALDVRTPDGVIYLGTSLASVWAVATTVPTIAIGVRRLRDAGRRWTELFWLLLPIAGVIVLIVRLSEPTRPESLTHLPYPA